jgi:hypothetical protein
VEYNIYIQWCPTDRRKIWLKNNRAVWNIQWCPTARRKIWLRNNRLVWNTISNQWCPTARRKIWLRNNRLVWNTISIFSGAPQIEGKSGLGIIEHCGIQYLYSVVPHR